VRRGSLTSVPLLLSDIDLLASTLHARAVGCGNDPSDTYIFVIREINGASYFLSTISSFLDRGLCWHGRGLRLMSYPTCTILPFLGVNPQHYTTHMIACLQNLVSPLTFSHLFRRTLKDRTVGLRNSASRESIWLSDYQVSGSALARLLTESHRPTSPFSTMSSPWTSVAFSSTTWVITTWFIRMHRMWPCYLSFRDFYSFLL
jgi:hypothetical protein